MIFVNHAIGQLTRVLFVLTVILLAFDQYSERDLGSVKRIDLGIGLTWDNSCAALSKHPYVMYCSL